jgi:hypothetical protein
MDNHGIYCPISKCRYNNADMCSISSGGTPMTFAMIGGYDESPYVAPIPMLNNVMTKNEIRNENSYNGASWSTWRSCPYLKSKLKKK